MAKRKPTILQTWRTEYKLISLSIRHLKSLVKSYQTEASSAYSAPLPTAVDALVAAGDITEAQALRIRRKIARAAYAPGKTVASALAYQKYLARDAMEMRKAIAALAALEWEYKKRDKIDAKHNQRLSR